MKCLMNALYVSLFVSAYTAQAMEYSLKPCFKAITEKIAQKTDNTCLQDSCADARNQCHTCLGCLALCGFGMVVGGTTTGNAPLAITGCIMQGGCSATYCCGTCCNATE